MLTPQDLLVNETLTDEKYDCKEYVCDCGKPVLYIADPQYDLAVGISLGIPKELVFTDADVDFRETPISKDSKENSIWAHHVLSAGKDLRVLCGGCGTESNMLICGPEGDEILALILDCETVQKQIPVSRVPYVEEKPAEWEKRENMSDKETYELMGKTPLK